MKAATPSIPSYATYWSLRLDDPYDRSRVGLELANENVRSVNHRYSDAMPVYESFPAFKDFPYGRGDHAQRSRDVVELAKWLKWISYYDYQSSEHPDWPQHFAIIGDIVGAKQAVMVAPSGGSADRTLPDRVPSNPRAFASLPALRALRPFPSPPVPAAAIFSGTHLGVP